MQILGGCPIPLLSLGVGGLQGSGAEREKKVQGTD